MTDKELLELAAKAAGELHLIPYREEWLESDEAWNPLTDDGDAFCLAVKLQLTVLPGIARDGEGRAYFEGEEDALASTRRAIVRAAAEIGRAM